MRTTSVCSGNVCLSWLASFSFFFLFSFFFFFTYSFSFFRYFWEREKKDTRIHTCVSVCVSVCATCIPTRYPLSGRNPKLLISNQHNLFVCGRSLENVNLFITNPISLKLRNNLIQVASDKRGEDVAFYFLQSSYFPSFSFIVPIQFLLLVNFRLDTERGPLALSFSISLSLFLSFSYCSDDV